MYKDLKVWQMSMDLVLEIYDLAEKFPKSEEYNLKSQIKRAIVSVPLNIAEGKARASVKDFGHFVNIAIGSLTEVEVVIELAKRLGYIKQVDQIDERITYLKKMLNSLRSKLIKG